MMQKPAANDRKRSVYLPVLVLLVVAGAFFAGCTDTGTISPPETVDIEPGDGGGDEAAPQDQIPADTFSAAQLSSLRYITEEFPPLNYRENGSAEGIAVDVLEEIFSRYDAGISVDVCEYLPWEEGYQAALTGPQTVLFSTARVPDREGLFQWAGPYAEGSLVLFAPAEEQYSIQSSDDLMSLRIGVIANTSSIPRLTTLGVPEASIVTGDDARALVLMLEEGTIDAWSTGDLSGRYLLREYAVNADAYVPVYTLATNEYYFAFSPDTPATVVTAFQQAIDEMKNESGEDGTSVYQEILYRHTGQGATQGL